MNLHLVYKSVTGKVIGSAIATDVRETSTLYVIEPKMVRILKGTPRFGGLRKYKKDTLRPYPKPNPFSGNGGWLIERVEG